MITLYQMSSKRVRIFKGKYKYNQKQTNHMKLFLPLLVVFLAIFQLGIVWAGLEFVLSKIIGGF